MTVACFLVLKGLDTSQSARSTKGNPYWPASFFQEGLPNEEEDDASRSLCFRSPDDRFREGRSYEGYADL